MEIFPLLASCAALGVFAGVIAGLLGVGGGLIIVPMLVAMYTLQGFPAELNMQLAVGTSLATIVFTSLSSAGAHHRRAAVDWPIVMQLSAGILLGAWLGGVVAHWLGGVLLALVFGVFELAVAVQMAFGGPPAAHRAAPGRARNALAGLVIGAVSALLGIGGGTLTVPYLVWHKVEVRRAVGTSSACGLPIALVGALGFVLVGRGVEGLPPGSSGFVYWPAALAVSVTSVASAPLGAWLAHRLDQASLKRLFALFIGLLGAWIIAKNLPDL